MIPRMADTYPLIERQPVKSSVVASIGYDLETKTLAVEEVKTGDVWLYSNVPPELAVAFESAPSMGVFYHKALAHKPELYPRRKLPDLAKCPKCGDTGVRGCTCDDCGCANYGDAVAGDPGDRVERLMDAEPIVPGESTEPGPFDDTDDK